MKKIYHLILVAVLFMSATFQLGAQVNGSAVKPIVSTAETPVYFYIESAADGTVNMGANPAVNHLGSLIYAPSSTVGVIFKHDLIDNITSTVSADNAMWQLVSENGSVKLKNKGTSLYMKDCKLGVTTTDFKFTATPFADNPTRYYLNTSDQKSYTLAWKNNTLDRWSYVEGNSQIAWFFIIAPGSEENYIKVLAESYKTELSSTIAASQNFLDTSVEGTDPGQFTSASRTTFASAIAGATEVLNTATTNEAVQAGTDALKSAKSTYISSTNMPIISDATAGWYYIKGTRPENTYITDKSDDNTIFNTTLIPDDTQIWKFVVNTSGTANGFAIQNKSTSEYINTDLANNQKLNSVATLPVNNLKFIPSDILSEGLLHFWIENAEGSSPALRLHGGGEGHNYNVMNWTGGPYDNSSWKIIPVPDTSTSTKDVENTQFKIAINNGVISVDGVNSFELYSISGQKVNEIAAQSSGVYILKVNEFYKKVIIR